MGGWVGASDMTSAARAERPRVGGWSHRLKTSETFSLLAGKRTQSCVLEHWRLSVPPCQWRDRRTHRLTYLRSTLASSLLLSSL